MKTKKYFLMVALAMAFGLFSCTEDDAETCDSEDVGKDLCTNDFSAVATFCTDGVSNSYYTYGGSKYECTGVEATTCDAALNSISKQMIADGCETSKSATLKSAEVKLSQMAEKLLLEVKTKSLSN